MFRNFRPRILNWKQSDFRKNVATLLTGNSISQILPLLVYPVLTRLYSTEDFGVLALFMSTSGILSILATGRYEYAILLPPKENKSFNLIALCTFICLITSLIVFTISTIWNRPISILLGSENIKDFLPFVGLMVLFTGFSQILNLTGTRYKEFKNVAGYLVINSTANTVLRLLLGIAAVAGGLIAAVVTSQIISTIYFGIKILKNKFRNILKQIRISEIKNVSREFNLFPRFNLLHAFTNFLSGNLPIFAFSRFFGDDITGLYSVGFTLLFRPVNLFTNSISQVMSQKIVERNRNELPLTGIFLKTIGRIVAYSAIPFIFIFLIAPFAFKIILGSEWYTAGVYVRIILPWIFFVLLCAPFAFVPMAFKRQKKALIIDIVYLFLRLISLATGILYNNIYLAIILFSASGVIMLGATLLWYHRILLNADRNKTIIQ